MSLTAEPHALHRVAHHLTSNGRGILAADESIRTMSTRLEAEGISASAENRSAYRRLLVTTPGLNDVVSGVILSDETFGQDLGDGRSFPDACKELGILPGIKVDTGTVEMPGTDGALITQGLDGLDDRLAAYAARGAAFAKWRAVFDVRTTTEATARANADALASYAAACQRHGVLPIVEPEVLADGPHDMVACALATRQVLAALFEALGDADVNLHGVVLKPNFVTPGLGCQQVSPRVVATITYDVLRDTVPAQVPGVAFLSGGHPTDRACAFLTKLNEIGAVPWNLTFSFGRALVTDALTMWGGSPANVTRAQAALIDNCRAAALATRPAA
jgi:fructose-bisphosphate aldolase class I